MIYSEFLDFDLQKSEINHLKSFYLEGKDVHPQIIEDLHSIIMPIKGDGLSLDIDQVGSDFFIEVYLIDIGRDDVTVEIIEAIDGYLRNLKNEKVDQHYESGLETINWIASNEGFFLSVEQPEERGSTNTIKEVLSSNDVQFKVLKHNQTFHDRGASGEGEAILLFIASTINSGITYDTIKFMLTKILGPGFETLGYTRTNAFRIDNKKFKSLRKEIASRVSETTNDLIVIDYDPNRQEGVLIKFKVRGVPRTTITVTCNNDYLNFRSSNLQTSP